jgi:hypothetical protein
MVLPNHNVVLQLRFRPFQDWRLTLQSKHDWLLKTRAILVHDGGTAKATDYSLKRWTIIQADADWKPAFLLLKPNGNTKTNHV